jgi:hypothetical protein
MPQTQVSSDSRSRPSQAAGPAVGCTLRDAGRGAAWVRTTGELDLVAAPQLARILDQATRRARIVVVPLRGLTRAGSRQDTRSQCSSITNQEDS